MFGVLPATTAFTGSYTPPHVLYTLPLFVPAWLYCTYTREGPPGVSSPALYTPQRRRAVVFRVTCPPVKAVSLRESTCNPPPSTAELLDRFKLFKVVLDPSSMARHRRSVRWSWNRRWNYCP